MQRRRRRKGNLGSVADAVPFPDLQKRLDLLLQVGVHVVVVEDTGSAAVGELVGMRLTQMVPRKGPMVQGRACSTRGCHWRCLSCSAPSMK